MSAADATARSYERAALLAAIARLWDAHPDLSLGYLLIAVACHMEGEAATALWRMSDSELTRRIERELDLRTNIGGEIEVR